MYKSINTVSAFPLLQCCRNLHIYHITGTGSAGTSNSKCRNHEIATDLPLNLGGRDTAVQPVELLLGSLIGCEIATATFGARHMTPRFPLLRIEFEYRSERDPNGALALPIEKCPEISSKLQRIWGTAKVHLQDGHPTETFERLQFLKDQVEQRCPIANMVTASGCSLTTKWDFASRQPLVQESPK